MTTTRHHPTHRAPRRRTAGLALALAALALAVPGCSLLGGGSDRERPTLYAPDVRVAPDPAWPSVTWQLGLADATAPRVIDSPRINVRPSAAELQVYAGALWAQSGTDLVENTVLHAFEDSGRIEAVARIETGIRSDYKLVLDLRRFESDYAGQPVPAATIEIAAKLLHNRSQRVVAARTFTSAQPAAGTQIDSVVTAFEQALAQITHDLVGWTLASGQADWESDGQAADRQAVPPDRLSPGG